MKLGKVSLPSPHCAIFFFFFFFYKTCPLFLLVPILSSFPGGSDSKESICNVGDLGLIPEWGRSPRKRHSNPLQCSWLEKFHGQRNVVIYSPWGCRVRHNWATHTCTHTQMHTHINTFSFFFGGGSIIIGIITIQF